MSAATDLLIWCITDKECAALYRGPTRRAWPKYFSEQLCSLIGRNPRGRLWAAIELNAPDVDEAHWKGRPSDLASHRAGIVIRREDYPHVENLVGFVTDFEMKALNLDDAFLEDEDCA